MSIKVVQNDFTIKMIDLTPLQEPPKNVRDLGKLFVATGFENKSPNLVTLSVHSN